MGPISGTPSTLFVLVVMMSFAAANRELRLKLPHPGFNAQPVLVMIPPGVVPEFLAPMSYCPVLPCSGSILVARPYFYECDVMLSNNAKSFYLHPFKSKLPSDDDYLDIRVSTVLCV
ncbi:hypothetical protein PTKIN_Ptkin13bG0269900 [Pterospermum kingtungense]